MDFLRRMDGGHVVTRRGTPLPTVEGRVKARIAEREMLQADIRKAEQKVRKAKTPQAAAKANAELAALLAKLPATKPLDARTA